MFEVSTNFEILISKVNPFQPKINKNRFSNNAPGCAGHRLLPKDSSLNFLPTVKISRGGVWRDRRYQLIIASADYRIEIKK